MYATTRRNPLPGLLTVAGVLAAALLAYAATTGSLMLVIALVGLAVVGATLFDWTVGVPVLLLVSCVDGFFKHLSDASINYVLKDATLMLILIGMVVRLAMNPDGRPDGTRWHGFLAWSAYFGFLLTQLLHPSQTFAGGIAAFRAHGGFAILFVVGAVYFQKRERLERAANGAIALCSLCALSAIAQHAMGDRWMHLSPGFLQASLHYASFPSTEARAAGMIGASYRMYGTLVDPAALGETCAFGILVAVAALARLRGTSRIFAALSIPVMSVAIELSQARASIAALAAGMIALVVMLGVRREVRAFAFVGLIAIALAVPVGVALTNGRIADRLLSSDSVAYAAQLRDNTRNETLYQLPAYPFGHGLGSTGGGGNLRDNTGFAVDNVYFSTLYETGIIGLTLLLVFQGTMLYFGIRAMLRAKTTSAYAVFAGIVAAQIMMMVNGWFSQGAFDYAPVAQFFWFFSGAVARSDAWA
jgi:hypothetical protein